MGKNRSAPGPAIKGRRDIAACVNHTSLCFGCMLNLLATQDAVVAASMFVTRGRSGGPSSKNACASGTRTIWVRLLFPVSYSLFAKDFSRPLYSCVGGCAFGRAIREKSVRIYALS